MTKKGDRMVQMNRSNLPEEGKMVVVGLVEALKLERSWLVHIQKRERERESDAAAPATRFTVSPKWRATRWQMSHKRSEKVAEYGRELVPMGRMRVENGLPGDLNVV